MGSMNVESTAAVTMKVTPVTMDNAE